MLRSIVQIRKKYSAITVKSAVCQEFFEYFGNSVDLEDTLNDYSQLAVCKGFFKCCESSAGSEVIFDNYS